MNESLRQQSRGGGTVACGVVGLGGNLAHQLCTHILCGGLQLYLLGDSNAVVGDEGCAELLLEHYVSALGAEGDFNGVCELVHSAEQCRSCIHTVKYFL